MVKIDKCTGNQITISWDAVPQAETYRIYWSDRSGSRVRPLLLEDLDAKKPHTYTLHKTTARPQYLWVRPVVAGKETEGDQVTTPVTWIRKPQTEQLNRGLVAMRTEKGNFLSWRLFKREVTGSAPDGKSLQGVDFRVYRNGKPVAVVTDSTNYLDAAGKEKDQYQVAPLWQGQEMQACEPVQTWEKSYLDLPLQKPADGITPVGKTYTYSANDMSAADVDGDGEYEYIVKWDPSNATDVSIKGYTGNCFLDCYKLDGRLLWRLDMGVNIRAGAHYTQFMCYDFDGDGKAEMAVKTAPGTRMTIYAADGSIRKEYAVTLPERDRKAGVTHEDNYVCSAQDYREYLVSLFMGWADRPEVVSGQWPRTLEACFGIEDRYSYPLARKDAEALVDYFLDVFAPAKNEKNDLRHFEGFIFKGPEYLTVFGGDGAELQTIDFPFPRVDDGFLWGDYAWKRIEPCNRVDRFLSGVAYLDGKKPSLLICRGYYTRTCIAAYDLVDGRLQEKWRADSGFVPMKNPFCDNADQRQGTDPVYGIIAGQGNHSLSTADVDGDGCMELIYGAACLDHDGSVLYSSKGRRPDGKIAKFGHGDAMHVADIDPDRPGLEIFNVFEGAQSVPYGYALRRAEDGTVIFGEYAEEDLGRCMIGDVLPQVRGQQCWVNGVGVYDCQGNFLQKETPGSNMSIHWCADESTQIIDGADYLHEQGTGKVCSLTRGILLDPEDTLTNNGTKGNPCLVADLFGDDREELLLRTTDSHAIRIYSSTELSHHKLFTRMEDIQYRCGIAWQNTCYNQPCYPEFYVGSDMDYHQVMPETEKRPVFYLAGDSTAQSYAPEARPQFGWGEFLLQALDGVDVIQSGHRQDSAFSQETLYYNRHLCVDNCAMAGRSSRSFRDEKRLQEIADRITAGDYLLIQFGHNDAAADKAERFVAVSDFAASLQQYIDAARKKGAVPVLISPISLHCCVELAGTPAMQIADQLPAYTAVMKELAQKEKLLFVDMQALTVQAIRETEEQTVRSWYKQDHVHLLEAGARKYAELFAAEFLRLTGEQWRIE